jgi:hypothetical protein
MHTNLVDWVCGSDRSIKVRKGAQKKEAFLHHFHPAPDVATETLIFDKIPSSNGCMQFLATSFFRPTKGSWVDTAFVSVAFSPFTITTCLCLDLSIDLQSVNLHPPVLFLVH